MIHQLVVQPNDDILALKKKARKLGMTGGYEIALSPEFNFATGSKLADKLLEELEVQYPQGSAAYRSSLAYRVIKLLEEKFKLSKIKAYRTQ